MDENEQTSQNETLSQNETNKTSEINAENNVNSQNENLPKVLSISLSAWRSDSGIHTQTDLFKLYDKAKVAQIYTKAEMPKTSVCDNFFRISENEVIKSVYTFKKAGRRVYNDATVDENLQKEIAAQNKLYAKAHKKKSWFMTLMREIVWDLGHYKSKALDKFIEEENPDVYFVPIYPVVYMGKLQLYVLKKHPRPYVCYLADDNYSYKPCGKNIFAYIHRFFLRKVVKKLAKNCNKMFTITQTEADETDKLFGTHSEVLTKGINYDGITYEPKAVSSPIKMVYTGNLLIGRAASLVEISKAMAKINENEQKITLDIYSPTQLDEKTMAYLNSNGCTFKGGVLKSEVDAIQKSADVVVFVESLEKSHRYDARLLFSTKLTDYFKNGKCIFAIGDKTIAPVIYLKDNDCAIIANEYNEIFGCLEKIVNEKGLIEEYGRKSFECGKRNHNEQDIKNKFRKAFVDAAKEK